MRTSLPRLLALFLLIVAGGSPALAARGPARAPVTILVSLDGFRPDYLDRGVTPNLSALAARGVRADMRPAFPTKTFPNHTTLVTGLSPDEHGVVDNNMVDPRRPGVTFHIDNAEEADPFWWAQEEPIWITAERAHVRTATLFWPGSDVPHDGVLPEDWFLFSKRNTPSQRVATVIDWLRRPAATRPRFVTLYFETVDEAGHHQGVDSPGMTEALGQVDRAVGALVAGLAALGQPANLVIVSDHGMASTSLDRLIPLASLVDPALVDRIADGTFATLNPKPGHEAEVAAALLRPHDHVTCWRHGQLPARFHYGNNPRVPAFFCLAELGWLIERPNASTPDVGNHGWDNQAPEMRAIFLASGPAFRSGVRLPIFDNVDVYPLLARLVRVAPRPNDGTLDVFRPALR